MKDKFLKLIKRQDGFSLPAVLAMFAIGSLMVLPSISYVATNLKAGTIVKEELKGILAADAAVEEALWKIENDTPEIFPYSYQITDINGLSVDVEIEAVTTIDGEEIGTSGGHGGWLNVDSSVTYDDGIYYYTMPFTNSEPKNIKIVKILVFFPPGAEYVEDSTSSNVTSPLDLEPEVIGGRVSGETLIWANTGTLPIVKNETKYHCFQREGDPGIEGIEGHGFVEALSEDVGTIWVSDVRPYSITAEARDSSGEVVTTIVAGVWCGNGQLEITRWQVIP